MTKPKRIALLSGVALLSAACSLVRAETASLTHPPVSAEEIIAAGLQVIQDEGWSAQDVADAIRSVRGLYLRDTKTKEGRQRWHGKLVRTIINTNDLVRVTVYEDGETFEDPFKVHSSAESNKRLTTVMTNGVPAALAKARARRAAEINQGVTNVTVTVTAGGGHD